MEMATKRTRTSRGPISFCALVAALMICLGFATQTRGSTGAFNYVWAVPLSLYDGPDEVGLSLTQLANGTIVVGGDDANQPNYCPPNYGGAWLVGVTPSGGDNVWQWLYSTCASDAQVTSYVAHTSDGGFVLAGGDFDNPACVLGCGWFAKFDSNGSITWQYDLTGEYAAGANQIEPTPDGGYIAVGNQTNTTYILQALIMKISPIGELQWSVAFPETEQSFHGAFTGGNFTFESFQQTRDGGYIVSGVADAQFHSGFANVLVVMKLDANANVQWSNAYRGNIWQSSAAGDSRYPIFQSADGGYVFSGSVQNRSYPYEALFFLLKLDPRGRILWQKGYGGANNYYHVSHETAGAVATADGGYVLAGESDIFTQGTNGWMLKTDGSGNILWQKTYTGLTNHDGNVFGQVIQTSDGGYAVTGSSWTADLTYGGPGMWLIKTDSNGNIGSCNCMKDTSVTPLPLDLGRFPATFTPTATNLTFGPVSIQGIATSIIPTTIYP